MKLHRKQLLLIVGCIVVLAIILSILAVLIHRPLTYDVSQAYPVSSNLEAVAAYGNDDLLYSNGQALILYNFSSGNSSQLSPLVGLSSSGIDSISVSPNNQYVLFHDEQVASGGALYAQLVNQGLSPQNNYWWLYSVGTQSFRPLPQTTLIAKLSVNGVEALASVGASEELVNYSISDLQPDNTINVSGINNFFVANSGFVLQTPSNNILFTQDGVVSQLIATDATIVALTSDGQQAVIVVDKNGSLQLALLDLQKRTQKSIASDITGQPVWSASGAVLYTASAHNSLTTLRSYSLITKKTYVWDFVGSASAVGQRPLTTNALFGDQTALISTSTNNFYLVGPNLAKPPVSL